MRAAVHRLAAVGQSPRRFAIAALVATALALAFGIRSSEGAVNGQARSEAPSGGRSLLGATVRPRRDRRPPRAPTGLSLIEATETSAALVWTAASDNVGVLGYDVYQDGEPVGTTSETGHAFTALDCGTSHTFSIRAWDAAGNRSREASVVAATAACADRKAPGQPGGLVQTATNETTVSIAWSVPGDDDVVGYGIYLGSLLVATTSEPAYALAGLRCGTSYTVGVSAHDASGNQSEQAETIVTTSACRDARAPAPPTALRQTDASETGVTVSWNGANRPGVAYGVYQNGVRAGETPETVYSLSGLSCGTTVTVAVDSYDRSGNRSPQVSIVATTAACSEPPPPPSGNDPPPPTAVGGAQPPSAADGEAPPPPTADGEAPSSPTDLAVGEVSETTVALAWGASDDNVGVVGYGLYAGGEPVGTTAGKSYTFAGLTCGTTYDV